MSNKPIILTFPSAIPVLQSVYSTSPF